MKNSWRPSNSFGVITNAHHTYRPPLHEFKSISPSLSPSLKPLHKIQLFVFQNPPQNEHLHAFFSNPHWETWQYVFVIFCYFLLVFSSRTEYVHTEVYSTNKIELGADMKQEYLKERRQTERQREWERGIENDKEGNTESLTKTTCSCAWKSIPINILWVWAKQDEHKWVCLLPFRHTSDWLHCIEQWASTEHISHYIQWDKQVFID